MPKALRTLVWYRLARAPLAVACQARGWRRAASGGNGRSSRRRWIQDGNEEQAEQRWSALAAAAKRRLAEFWAPPASRRDVLIEAVLTMHLPLTADELEDWQADPEAWYHANEGVLLEVELRGVAEIVLQVRAATRAPMRCHAEAWLACMDSRAGVLRCIGSGRRAVPSPAHARLCRRSSLSDGCGYAAAQPTAFRDERAWREVAMRVWVVPPAPCRGEAGGRWDAEEDMCAGDGRG